VGHNGLSRDFEEQLVDVGPHAGAASGGDDDGAGHEAQSPKSKAQSQSDDVGTRLCEPQPAEFS